LLLRPEQQEVPDVVGERSATAAQIVQNHGFEVDIVPIKSDTVPEDRVAGQDPEPGTEADDGSTVTLNVSSGPGDAPVPIVQGLPADDAADKLRAAGFKSEQRREYSDTVKSGRVIETSPPEGSTARKGTTVTLVVSRGKQQVAVPGLIGKSRDQAEQLVRDAGLALSVSEREDADVQPGIVIAQDPAAGTELAKGKTVAIVVAKAPAEVAVPGVIDATEADAVDALEAAGFNVKRKDAEAGSPEEDGLVLAQKPAPQTPKPKGSTVTITIGRFEPEVVPEGTATPSPGATP
jgi:eukaryotic-like serine/threonine-protein kinase